MPKLAFSYTATFHWSGGNVIQYPFHFGTEESVARESVLDRWQWKSHILGQAQSAALWRDGAVIDVYLGAELGWANEILARHTGARS